MNTRELRQCMGQDYWISKTSFGVFPRNHLPPCEIPGLYIVNVDSSEKPGTHWLLIYIDSSCDGRVYDSLGSRQPYAKLIENIIHGRCVWMVENRLQCYTSNVCGAYALYFARELARGSESSDILRSFTGNCDVNDAFICEYVSKYMNISSSVMSRIRPV